jgi:hypothetical protein
MVKGKKRAGKGAAKKASGTSKPRKRAARKSAAKPGIGHNQPPEPPVPPPPDIRSWQAQDDGGAAIARWTAARQRAFRAATSSGPVAPPLAVTNDPATLHQEMRKRIAALEETIAKLPTASDGLLNDSEIDETKSEIATLKTLPPVPAAPPTEAAGAQSRLAKFGEMVLQRLAADEAGRAITAASKALWAQYGDQLIALARSIGDWIASLPPPP